jgi:ribonuclease P protein component
MTREQTGGPGVTHASPSPPPPGSGSGAATFPREARLRRRADFTRVLNTGRLHAGRECVVRVARGALGHARLGVGAPARYGSAVRRNRFRRLVREAFRHLRGTLPAVDLLVAPRRGLVEPTLAGLRADLEAAVARRPADPPP